MSLGPLGGHDELGLDPRAPGTKWKPPATTAVEERMRTNLCKGRYTGNQAHTNICKDDPCKPRARARIRYIANPRPCQADMFENIERLVAGKPDNALHYIKLNNINPPPTTTGTLFTVNRVSGAAFASLSFSANGLRTAIDVVHSNPVLLFKTRVRLTIPNDHLFLQRIEFIWLYMGIPMCPDEYTFYCTV